MELLKATPLAEVLGKLATNRFWTYDYHDCFMAIIQELLSIIKFIMLQSYGRIQVREKIISSITASGLLEEFSVPKHTDASAYKLYYIE